MVSPLEGELAGRYKIEEERDAGCQYQRQKREGGKPREACDEREEDAEIQECPHPFTAA